MRNWHRSKIGKAKGDRNEWQASDEHACVAPGMTHVNNAHSLSISRFSPNHGFDSVTSKPPLMFHQAMSSALRRGEKLGSRGIQSVGAAKQKHLDVIIKEEDRARMD